MKEKILRPLYMRDFSCIGPACEDTCCKEWIIIFDREETRTLEEKTRDSKEFHEQVLQSVKKNRGNDRRFGHATLRLNEDGMCPFLQEGLCSLQRAYGSEILTMVCNTYPRVYNYIGDCSEMSVDCSCPEAARRVLLPQVPMEFEITEVEPVTNTHRMWSCGYKELGTYPDRLLALRNFLITIMQTRRFSIPERLLLVGMYLKECIDLDYTSLQKRNSDFENLLADDEFVIQMPEGDENRQGLQMVWLTNLLHYNTNIFTAANEFTKIIGNIQAAFGLRDNDEPDDNRVLERYIDARDTLYAEYLSDKEYIFENLIVNDIFTQMYPHLLDPVSAVLHMATRYSIAHFLLVGQTAVHGTMNDELMVHTIMNLYRRMLHSPEYIKQQMQYIKGRGWDDLAHIAILINN